MDTALKQQRFAIENGALTRLGPPEGTAFLGRPVPLWEVTLRHRDGAEASFRAQDFPQEETSAGRLSWRPRFGGEGRCRVVVTIDEETDGALSWRIAVDELPADWTVARVRFPCFDWKLEATDRYKMVIPEDRGRQVVNPLVNLPDLTELWQRRRFRERKYPNNFATMQCLGLICGDDLLYFAAHDPTPVVKNIYFEPDAASETIRLRPMVETGWRYGEPYASFPWVTALDKGDWFDVARRYRKFALTAPWTQAGPLEESDKTPRWLQDAPMILLRHYRGDMHDADALLKVAAYMQVPLVLHYYMWQQSAHDANYPFLFPATPEFRAELKRLQEAGIRVIPYIDTYSADTCIDEWLGMEALAVRKNPQQELHAQVWSQNRALAAICPAHPLAGRIASLVALRCVEMGVDGLYFDELGCSPAHNCYAANHGHVVGDERAFVAGHRRTLAAIRQEAREIRPDFVMATEGCPETYLDLIDTYLAGNENLVNEVPLFEAVYHDYVTTYGQYMFCEEFYEPRFKDALFGKVARQFVSGAKFAWSRIPMVAMGSICTITGFSQPSHLPWRVE